MDPYRVSDPQYPQVSQDPEVPQDPEDPRQPQDSQVPEDPRQPLPLPAAQRDCPDLDIYFRRGFSPQHFVTKL